MDHIQLHQMRRESRTGNEKSVGSTPTREKARKRKEKKKKQTLASLVLHRSQGSCSHKPLARKACNASLSYPAPEKYLHSTSTREKGQRLTKKMYAKNTNPERKHLHLHFFLFFIFVTHTCGPSVTIGRCFLETWIRWRGAKASIIHGLHLCVTSTCLKRAFWGWLVSTPVRSSKSFASGRATNHCRL